MRDPVEVEIIARAVGLKTWPAFVERACCDKKEIYLNGGWRGGKSASLAFLLFIRIVLEYLGREGVHLFWLIGPDYEQARPEYFYLSTWCSRLGLQVSASTATQGSLRMEIFRPGMPGRIEVVTKSATDPTSLGSVAPVEIGVCEAGQISEEAWMWIQGRTAEKNSNVILAGTFENDDGKAQFAWFEQESDAVWQKPSTRRSAFRLPTWENLSLYASCSLMLADDLSLASWCPDQSNHGTAHSGLNHPMIRQLKERWRDRPRDWDKRFGGIPQGVSNPVYEWSLRESLTDFSRNLRFISMSEAQKRQGTFHWTRVAGGLDPGEVHPAGLVITGVNQFGDHWIRNSVKDTSGSAHIMWGHKDMLEKIYKLPGKTLWWGGDPTGLRYQRKEEHIKPMVGSLFAREERVRIVNGLALPVEDHPNGRLFIDSDIASNVLLVAEIQRTHRRKNPDGSLRYDRRQGEDLVAAYEDSEGVLSEEELVVPARWSVPKKRRSYSMTPVRSVS